MFLERNKEEAIEIVHYLNAKLEITKEEAEVLLEKIETEGLRSFGSLKTWGFYERNFRKNINQNNDEILDEN